MNLHTLQPHRVPYIKKNASVVVKHPVRVVLLQKVIKVASHVLVTVAKEVTKVDRCQFSVVCLNVVSKA
jgi:hypothetical protein